MKYFLMMILMLASASVLASPYNKGGDKTYNSSESNSGVYGSGNAKVSQGQANIQKGNDVTVEDNSNYEAYDRDNTPNAGAPGLIAGASTCLGSASGGLSVPGFGFSAGSTTLDKGCQAINGSIRFAQLGLNAAAVQVMCNVDMYRKTLAETGYVCDDVDSNSLILAPETVFTSGSSVGSGFLGR